MANIRWQQHQRRRLNDASEAFEEAFGDGPNLAEAESEANPQDAAAPAPAAANNIQNLIRTVQRRRLEGASEAFGEAFGNDSEEAGTSGAA